MGKYMTQQELQDLSDQIERMHNAVVGPPYTVLSAIVEVVVPRLIATIRYQQQEIVRVSGALADELLYSMGVNESEEILNLEQTDDDFHLFDENHGVW